MAMVNIPSTNVDPDYRYQMPRLISKIEGRGNGIKTCIINMGDVARAIKRPPQYATKFFGSELGIPSHYSDKEGDGERCLIDGSHDISAFQGLLDEFIEKYICCEQCDLPELDLLIVKGAVHGKCKACGWSSEMDNDHRLANFITKHPPDESGLRLKACGKLMKKGAKGLQVLELDSDIDDDDDFTDDTSACSHDDRKTKTEKEERSPSKQMSPFSAEKISPSSKDKKEKKNKREASKETTSPTTSPLTSPSPSKEKKEKKEKKVKKEKKERKSSKETTTTVSSDEMDNNQPPDKMYGSREIKTVIKTLRNYVEKSADHMSVDDFFDELRLVQLAEVFDHKMRLYVALEALLGSIFDTHSVLAKKEHLNKAITSASMSAPDILWAFGAYIETHPSTATGFTWILKTMYDEDWVTEVDILEYYGSEEFCADPGFVSAQSHATPFLRWLTTVESADEDQEEDE